MDDEEEDMPRPVSSHWGTPVMDAKDRAMQGRVRTWPLGDPAQSRPLVNGNNGYGLHFPALPGAGRGQRHGGNDRARRPAEDVSPSLEGDPAAHVEAQIGRKLREIGDRFNREHLQLLVRHQRDRLPAWWRLTMALCDFLFRRENPR